MRASSRLVRLLTSSLVLALTVLLGFGQAARADVTDPARLTITAPTSVGTGALTSISGKLTDSSGKVIKNAPVVVHWRTVGATKWAGSASVTTSTKGTWSTKIVVRLNTQLQANYAGGTTATASGSPLVTVTARQSVRITSVSPSKPAIGDKVIISGTTSRAFRNSVVSLQRRTNGVWSTIAEPKVSNTGTFSASLRIKNATALVLRVRSTATRAVSRSTTSTRYVYIKVSGTMAAGQQLTARHVLTSPTGQYTATMQTDGNLVVRSWGSQIWSSNTSVKGAALTLSNDGQLTLAASVKGAKTRTLWKAGNLATTAGKARLVMQNDGNLVLWSQAKSSWSSKLGLGSKAKPAACWSTSFDCISYTSYNPSIMYWRMYSGHNCVNYVAYRMILKGVKNPPWGYPGGSAWQWRGGAKKAKIKVDHNPAVGSVMQWGRNSAGGGNSGHVVYVEKVTPTAVVISEDSWSSHASYRTIQRSSRAFADARFLHIKDDVVAN